jgi:HEAT repeat protein
MSIFQTAVFFLALIPQVGEDLPQLEKALQSPDAKVRLGAARDFSRLASKANVEPANPALLKQLRGAVPALFTQLNGEKSPEVRARLIHAINTISFQAKNADNRNFRPVAEIDDKILKAIAPYLDDESAEVRVAAINGLRAGRQKSKFAVPKLVEAVKEEDHAVKYAAMSCLLLIGPDAAPALPLLRTEREKALQAIQNKDHPARKKYSPETLDRLWQIADTAIRVIEKKDKSP